MRLFCLLILLAISLLVPASSSAEGWPGDALTLGSMPGRIYSAWSAMVAGDSFGRMRVSQPVIEGDVELNQAGGATTALCSLTWEALQ